MIEYKICLYNDDSDYQFTEQAKIELEKLIEKSDFIVTSWGTMYPKESIKGITDSIRGVSIKFADNNITYGYNIYGGYSKTTD